MWMYWSHYLPQRCWCSARKEAHTVHLIEYGHRVLSDVAECTARNLEWEVER